MRLFRKLLPILTTGVVTLSIVGAAAALEGGSPPSEEPATVVAPTDEVLECPDVTVPEGADADAVEGTESDPTEAVDSVEGDEDGRADEGCDEADDPQGEDTNVDESDPVVEPSTTPDSAAVHPDNHGAAVSEAAHTCPPGPEHGACVREVAQSDAGKDHGTTDQVDGSDDGPADSIESADDSGHPSGRGHGVGKGGRAAH